MSGQDLLKLFLKWFSIDHYLLHDTRECAKMFVETAEKNIPFLGMRINLVEVGNGSGLLVTRTWE
jgi:hypothetical protein